MWHSDFYPMVRSSRILAYSTLWRPNGWGPHSTPFKWSRDQLEYHDSLFLNNIPLWEISTIRSLSRLTQMISNEHMSKRGIKTHTRARVAATTHTQDKNDHTKTAHRSYNSKKCSNLYHNEPNTCLRNLGVVECSMGAWCIDPCA